MFKFRIPNLIPLISSYVIEKEYKKPDNKKIKKKEYKILVAW